METNVAFWQALDTLLSQSRVVIDRPRGTHHPRYPACVYPLDYGYLEGTSSMDGGGIDVWRGTRAGGGLDAAVCTVDLLKKDSEIKLLLDCDEEEKETVLRFHNDSQYMKGLLLRRGPAEAPQNHEE